LPMLRQRGIASIILENPFYGLRKPKYQVLFFFWSLSIPGMGRVYFH
jgi:hypothetical protein